MIGSWKLNKIMKMLHILNVFVISTSHDDVGYLKTVDDYFWGKKPEIQIACVKDILDNVTEQLALNVR